MFSSFTLVSLELTSCLRTYSFGPYRTETHGEVERPTHGHHRRKHWTRLKVPSDPVGEGSPSSRTLQTLGIRGPKELSRLTLRSITRIRDFRTDQTKNRDSLEERGKRDKLPPKVTCDGRYCRLSLKSHLRSTKTSLRTTVRTFRVQRTGYPVLLFGQTKTSISKLPELTFCKQIVIRLYHVSFPM